LQNCGVDSRIANFFEVLRIFGGNTGPANFAILCARPGHATQPKIVGAHRGFQPSSQIPVAPNLSNM
jgi:hypothetical protein